MTLEMRPIDTIEIPNKPYNLILKKDSLGRSVEANIISKHPLYDTSFGIIELFLRDGVLVRGFGFKIDSLSTLTHAKDVGMNAIYIPQTDTIHNTLKAFFQPCSCFIDTKKYYRFIPLENFQDIDIYEDEHISISPNENYKK